LRRGDACVARTMDDADAADDVDDVDDVDAADDVDDVDAADDVDDADAGKGGACVAPTTNRIKERANNGEGEI